MSIIATALKHLIAAGVSGDDLVRAVAEMEAAAPASVDRAAENRRAYDRERKRKAKAKRSTGIPPESAETAERVSPNEYISNPHPEPVSANADTAPFPVRVVEAWNEMAAANGLSPARKLNPKRLAMLRTRTKEHGEAAVFEAIANLGRSDWHCGRKAGSDWKANLGWLLESPEKFQRLLELGEVLPPAAKPADPEEFKAFCLRSADRCRQMGREQEAVDWEAKSRGDEPRRNGSGPVRSIGALLDIPPLRQGAQH